MSVKSCASSTKLENRGVFRRSRKVEIILTVEVDRTTTSLMNRANEITIFFFSKKKFFFFFQLTDRFTVKTGYVFALVGAWSSDSDPCFIYSETYILLHFPTRSSKRSKHPSLIHWQWHWAKCFSFIVLYICLSVCRFLKGNICRHVHFLVLFCLY